MINSPYNQPSYFDEMPSMLSVEKWQSTINLIASIYDAPGAWLMQANIKGLEAIVASNVKENQYPAGFYIGSDVGVYCQRVIQAKEQLYVRNAELEGNWDDNPDYTEEGFISYLGVPIQWPNGNIFGTLCVLDKKETNYTDDFIGLMWQLKGIIDGDLLNMTLFNELKHQSITDELTNINNRRGFKSDSDNLIRLAKRNELSLALIYFDINNLKEVNDLYGHKAGDFLIECFSEALSKSIRNEDIIARLGGDEFCFLGVHKNESESIGLKSRIQNKFEALAKSDSRIVHPTFSSGNKLYTKAEDFNIEEMLSEVDGLMYMNKYHSKKVCI